MYYNKSHEFLGKTLKNIIRVMQNIGFTKSPHSTTIKPEKLRITIEKTDHKLPTICS